MFESENFLELFKIIQEEALPRLWSHGVNLSRGQNQFVQLSKTENEIIVQLRISGQMVSPKVTLWPIEKEWDCDCESTESPCAHVAAVMIVAK